MDKAILILICSLLSLCSLAQTEYQQAVTRQKTMSEFKELRYLDNIKAPDPGLSDGTGNKVIDYSKSDFNLIVFFETWCAPCIEEIPLLFDLAKNSTKLSVFVVSKSDMAEVKKKFRSDGEGTEFIFIGGSNANQLAEAFIEGGYPRNYLINKSGIIKGRFRGFLGPEDEAYVRLQSLIK